MLQNQIPLDVLGSSATVSGLLVNRRIVTSPCENGDVERPCFSLNVIVSKRKKKMQNKKQEIAMKGAGNDFPAPPKFLTRLRRTTPTRPNPTCVNRLTTSAPSRRVGSRRGVPQWEAEASPRTLRSGSRSREHDLLYRIVGEMQPARSGERQPEPLPHQHARACRRWCV